MVSAGASVSAWAQVGGTLVGGLTPGGGVEGAVGPGPILVLVLGYFPEATDSVGPEAQRSCD